MLSCDCWFEKWQKKVSTKAVVRRKRAVEVVMVSSG